jgi:hypothetical protein
MALTAQEKEVIRGAEAERLLDSEILKEAFEKTRQGIIDAMQQAPMGDEKTHNRLVIALQLLNQIEKQIKDVATTGKLASLQVTQFGDRIKSVFRA